jgi:Tat protein secretion system quality control protein TatD with DNase activity
MLLETDSPWLDPKSNDLVNRPWKIAESAKVIAKIKKIEPKDVLKQTSKNARKVFSIHKSVKLNIDVIDI